MKRKILFALCALFAGNLIAAEKVCLVLNDEDAEFCTVGKPLVYLPSRFGNEQMPIHFSSLYCDPNKPIALTKGGVYCTFSGKKEFESAAALKIDKLQGIKRGAFSKLMREAQNPENGWTERSVGYLKITQQGKGKKVEGNDVLQTEYWALDHNLEPVGEKKKHEIKNNELDVFNGLQEGTEVLIFQPDEDLAESSVWRYKIMKVLAPKAETKGSAQEQKKTARKPK